MKRLLILIQVVNYWRFTPFILKSKIIKKNIFFSLTLYSWHQKISYRSWKKSQFIEQMRRKVFKEDSKKKRALLSPKQDTEDCWGKFEVGLFEPSKRRKYCNGGMFTKMDTITIWTTQTVLSESLHFLRRLRDSIFLSRLSKSGRSRVQAA